MKISIAKLSRITSTGTYIPEVDGIRFIAIFSVIIYHVSGDIFRHSAPGYYSTVSGPVFWLTQHGNFGVQLFFVLSGFVLALPFARSFLSDGPHIDLGRYFVRRLTRLEPPYFAALLLFFVLKVMGKRGGIPGLGKHLLASMGYLHNLIYGRPSDIDYVAWSLEIEVQFYLILPFLAAIVFQYRKTFVRRIVLVVAILLWAKLVSVTGFSPRVGLSLYGQLPYFLSGVLLADFQTVGRPLSYGSLPCDCMALGAFVALTAWVALPSLTLYMAPLTICAAYYGSFRGVWTKRFLSLSLVSTVGGMCYSVYLLHNYVIALCGFASETIGVSLPFEYRLAVQLLIMIPLILAASVVFFVVIERPCMRPDWFVRLKQRIKHLSNGGKLEAISSSAFVS